MKFIVINGKKVGIVIMLVGLMVVLLGLEIRFDNRLRSAVLVQNNIKMKKYSALNNVINYELPEEWTTREENFPGGEILYHNNFIAKEYNQHGFIEVWNLKEDLKSFLDKSKVISDKQNINKDYSITPIEIDNKKGYLVKYSIRVDKTTYFTAFEYFIKYDNKFVRFSFFIKEDDFKDSDANIYRAIAETLKIKP